MKGHQQAGGPRAGGGWDPSHEPTVCASSAPGGHWARKFFASTQSKEPGLYWPGGGGSSEPPWETALAVWVSCSRTASSRSTTWAGPPGRVTCAADGSDAATAALSPQQVPVLCPTPEGRLETSQGPSSQGTGLRGGGPLLAVMPQSAAERPIRSISSPGCARAARQVEQTASPGFGQNESTFKLQTRASPSPRKGPRGGGVAARSRCAQPGEPSGLLS